MRVGGVVALDLRPHDTSYSEDGHELTHKLKCLTYAPAGVDVMIHISPRQFADFQGLNYLRREGQHLGSVTFHCEDAETVADWVKALRGKGL